MQMVSDKGHTVEEECVRNLCQDEMASVLVDDN